MRYPRRITLRWPSCQRQDTCHAGRIEGRSTDDRGGKPASSPQWERIVCLSELASLGKLGEGPARFAAVDKTQTGPVPHPAVVSVSVAGAPCDANAGRPLPQGGEGASAAPRQRNIRG